MLPAFGLYTHIRQNEVRSRILVAGLFALNLVLAYGIALILRGMSANLPAGARPGLSAYLHAAVHDLLWIGPLSFAVTFAWLFVAYHANRAMISATVGAHPVAREEAPDLYRLLEPLCISRGMAMPRLYLADAPALNAFATGLNPEQYAITVTTGLREALTPREMQAVLGHELTHIRNDDVRTMMIAIVIAGIFAFVAEIGFRTDMLRGLVSRNREEKNRAGALPAILIGALLIALAWFLSKLIRFALSRSREFVADAGAVELTKDPDALISALAKISGRGDLVHAPSGVMELCFDNPRLGFTDFLATHPPIEARIDALVRYAGGRLPPPV